MIVYILLTSPNFPFLFNIQHYIPCSLATLLVNHHTASHIIAQAPAHFLNILSSIHQPHPVSKMRVTQSVAVGLVSLLCTVNASRATAKPVLAKSQVGQQVTVSQNGCTAVCMDNQDEFWASSCEVYCDQTSSTKMPATSTYTSTLRSTVTSTVTSKAKATLTKPSVVSANTGACHETCSVNEAEGDIDCSFSCDADFSTAMPVALHQRTVVSAVQDDCTAVCWDLMPGTECDVQCSSDFKTAMPGNTAHSNCANHSDHLAVIFHAQSLFNPVLLSRFLRHWLTNSPSQ